MGVFSTGGIGIDLGSANLTICLENEGIVLREPTCVLNLRDDPDEVLAVGRDARQMLGRTPKEVVMTSPVADGAVADIDQATMLMKKLAEKALGKRRALEKNRLAVTMSTGATRVEQSALLEAINRTGARKAVAVRACIAAAIGAGLPVEEPKCTLLVLIGGSVTEVAIMTMNGIAACRSSRTGSLAMDEAIVRYIRREKNLLISQRTAEDLKIDVGTALEIPMDKLEPITLRGRSALDGRPASAEITALDIQRAILPVLDTLLESIRDAFDNAPAEFAEDLVTGGIYLSGGGAMLEGLKDRLSQLLGMPVTVSEEPQDDAAAGACVIASDDRLCQKLIASGCVIEV